VKHSAVTECTSGIVSVRPLLAFEPTDGRSDVDPQSKVVFFSFNSSLQFVGCRPWLMNIEFGVMNNFYTSTKH